VLALGVAHLVYKPEPGVSADQYARWRAYCSAEADRAELPGTRAWVGHVNDCLVDVAAADARLNGR
jgi:hypothetical protein